MIRRFNFKRRKTRIARSLFDFEIINNENENFYIKGNKIDLSSFDLNSDFQVNLKVWTSGSVRKNIYLGTVSQMELNPIPEKCRLDFIKPGITHCVKGELFITDPSNSFQKVISSKEFDVKKFDILKNTGSILPVALGDIGDRPWEIEFNDNEFPILKLNQKLGGEFQELMGRPGIVQTLIAYPVLEQILTRILIVEQTNSAEENPDSWTSKWLILVLKINSAPIPKFDPRRPNYGVINEWVSGVADSLCYQSNFVNIIKREISNLGG